MARPKKAAAAFFLILKKNSAREVFRGKEFDGENPQWNQWKEARPIAWIRRAQFCRGAHSRDCSPANKVPRHSLKRRKCRPTALLSFLTLRKANQAGLRTP